MRETAQTCQCGEPLDEQSVNWPGNNGDDICQNCWEAECDEAWWEMVRALPAVSSL